MDDDEQKALRRARWSRDPSKARTAKVAELEEQLNKARQTYGEIEEEESRRDSWSMCSTADNEDEPVALSGFLMKKSGAFSGLKRRFCVLNGGTLIWFKSETDTSTPAGYVHLRECSVITEQAGPKSPRASTRSSDGNPTHGFVVKSIKEYLLWADDESERDKWLRALRHNRNMPPLDALSGAQPVTARRPSWYMLPLGPLGSQPTDVDVRASLSSASSSRREEEPAGSPKGGKRSILGNVALRMEKKMVGRAVTSDIGKKLLREYCLPETFVLLQALRDLASRDPKMPPKAGQKVEETILRMAVKVALLHQHGRLAPQDFQPIVTLVDHLCISCVRKYDVTRKPPHSDVHDPDHEIFGRKMTNLAAAMGTLLEGHVSDKNVGALKDVIDYLGSPANLSRFLSVPACTAELAKISETLRLIYRLEAPEETP